MDMIDFFIRCQKIFGQKMSEKQTKKHKDIHKRLNEVEKYIKKVRRCKK